MPALFRREQHCQHIATPWRRATNLCVSACTRYARCFGLWCAVVGTELAYGCTRRGATFTCFRCAQPTRPFASTMSWSRQLLPTQISGNRSQREWGSSWFAAICLRCVKLVSELSADGMAGQGCAGAHTADAAERRGELRALPRGVRHGVRH